MKCDYRWFAPWVLPDGGGQGYSQQKCVLEAGHDGDHRSQFNVTCANTKIKKES
jgi:hypothetical protein